jgi:hypothetical protein
MGKRCEGGRWWLIGNTDYPCPWGPSGTEGPGSVLGQERHLKCFCDGVNKEGGLESPDVGDKIGLSKIRRYLKRVEVHDGFTLMLFDFLALKK